MDRLAVYIRDRDILNLIGQYLRRTAESGGWFWECERGISLGCPLSPLIGAFFLDQLDRRMNASGLFYVRFMDDILVLAPTRWKLRRAVGLVNRILGTLRLEKHPDKTFIGRIERGFDFLGYHFTADSLTLAGSTLANFADRAARLYEQERERPKRPSPARGLCQAMVRLGERRARRGSASLHDLRDRDGSGPIRTQPAGRNGVGDGQTPRRPSALTKRGRRRDRPVDRECRLLRRERGQGRRGCRWRQ